ncbi:MAG: hypothetical protein BJ554DRAFT_5760 [Olpidium bornovanus]|uniref:Rad50/SbcC-type AAA domain-containing protein n=1 Tax=Olpidium bornovanus TaxID=278681 RepID=A0A8H7ZZ18_9FUNG|nr:MAG: hypothetical protein BJ554DRAFT_5760 [Olpidium bornovanus]
MTFGPSVCAAANRGVTSAPGSRVSFQVSRCSSPENDGQVEQHDVPVSQELLEKEKLLKRTIERDKVKREKRRGSSGPEDPAEAGIIESITLADFMCHRKMEFTFGPQINFIIGHNGSAGFGAWSKGGKSAILTALTLCFGGKANVTQRGSKVADFVRDGATRSEITVRIKNQGSEAFLPEKYGKTIVVTRRFAKEGGAQWIVRSADGSYVAAKPREELSYICDAFGIQVDNPLIILSQDTSREFLKSSSPDDKYSVRQRPAPAHFPPPKKQRIIFQDLSRPSLSAFL